MKKWVIFSSTVIIVAIVLLFVNSQINTIRNGNSDAQVSDLSQKSKDTETGVANVQKNDDEQCEETKVKFDYAPVNLDETEVFLPLGLMIGSHVTPIDHHYFQNFNNNEPDIEVYSPGAGYVTSIQLMQIHAEVGDYRVVIEHKCKVSSIYIHIYTLSEKLQKEITDKNYLSTKIPVEAGELIGYYKNNVDYNLVDENFVLTGFANPSSYESEPWKIHVPNTFEYFNEPVKSQLMAKILRTAEPISGKIDYDISGKLAGNWFLEGTNGYAGAVSNPGDEGYWLGHLSFVYDAYDPERIVLSIGGYGGEDSKQFAVRGNSPDPKDVDVQSGAVKYELITYDWLVPDGSSWDRKSLAKPLTTQAHENNVEGAVLVQVLEGNKIKFEAFQGKAANQVSGFMGNAKIYER